MGIFDKYRQKRTRSEADEAFQVKEHDGGLWLTFNGGLVCPFSMIKQEPVEALKAMRELYIKRNG